MVKSVLYRSYAFLRYGISERKVYDLIKRFKTDCNLCAV